MVKKSGKGILSNCPDCGSSEISAHDYDSDGNSCWYTVTCDNCHECEWLEIFENPHYEILD